MLSARRTSYVSGVILSFDPNLDRFRHIQDLSRGIIRNDLRSADHNAAVKFIFRGIVFRDTVLVIQAQHHR